MRTQQRPVDVYVLDAWVCVYVCVRYQLWLGKQDRWLLVEKRQLLENPISIKYASFGLFVSTKDFPHLSGSRSLCSSHSAVTSFCVRGICAPRGTRRTPFFVYLQQIEKVAHSSRAKKWRKRSVAHTPVAFPVDLTSDDNVWQKVINSKINQIKFNEFWWAAFAVENRIYIAYAGIY